MLADTVASLFSPSTAALLATVGAFIAAREVLSFFGVLYKTCLRGGKNLRRTYGEWAVVTGATDGIGKAFALEFARRGLNVVLVGRSVEKLQATQAEVSGRYPAVSVRYEVFDFSSFGRDESKRMEAALASLDVGVLVNNVGVSYPFPQWFHELSDDEVSSLVSINVSSLTWMTRAVLPGMLARKRGAVVNMSSASARAPLPLLAGYSASKGYVENLTRSLAYEYAGKGLHFQCQSPLWVSTAMTYPGSKVAVEKRASLTTPTAASYARYAVSRIGSGTMVSPYWVHELYLWIQMRTSDALVGMAALQMHKGVRFHKKNVAKMAEKKSK